MLFIQKTQPSQDLSNWIIDQKSSGISLPKYSNLQTKNSNAGSFLAYDSLRKQLYKEQNGLCCYCMKKITPDNSNIEHFLPQSAFPEHEVDYYNLYLACRYSHGFSREKQHCDIAKENQLISKFIGYNHAVENRKCQDFFQYTDDGYILPKKSGYATLQKFHQNYVSLTAQEKELLGTIEVLNLNCESLLNDRMKFIKDLKELVIPQLSDIPSVNKKVLFYETESTKFAGVALYFLRERLNKL